MKTNNENKLSVVVCVYNTEKYLKKCIDSIIKQSFNNIELIVVNDCSKGNCDEIIKNYNNIIYVKNKKNLGVYKSRLIGAKRATGKYIAFVDSDDYVGIDFYRELIESAEEECADIVTGNTILTHDDGKKKIISLFRNAIPKKMENKDILDNFMKQQGLCYQWHTVWNKIYKKDIWDKAENDLDIIDQHVVMTDDLAFSTVLFYYAKKAIRVDADGLFYCQHKNTATESGSFSKAKIKKNISDMIIVFNFIEKFLKDKNLLKEYDEDFKRFRALYYKMWKNVVDNAIKEERREIFYKALKKIYNGNLEIENENYFYQQTINWNDGLYKIKEAICDENVKCVSFDIFDTLITRPFLMTTDLFVLMNKYFREISNTKIGIDFSKVRVESEKYTRELMWKDNSEKQEITLDEIYKTIKNIYDIDSIVLDKMKNKEIELEIKYSNIRKTGYQLYKLAQQQGKKVVFTSDMYLPKKVIVRILEKNGYESLNKIYISSEHMITKANGELFTFVLNDLNINAEDMVHIGDNWQSDYTNPCELGIKGKYIPRTINTYMDCDMASNISAPYMKPFPSWDDNTNGINFFGIRCMIALVANKYFDNPFRPFDKNSDFNEDPELIGYYALGMQMYGLADWLISNTINKYDKILFMARDGYIPMKAYNLLSKIHNNTPKSEYMYVSRKSLMPIVLLEDMDFYKIFEVFNINKHTPEDLVECLGTILNKSESKLNKICNKLEIEKDKTFANISVFNKFVKEIKKEMYNEKEHKKIIAKLKEYFNNICSGKSCVFDIGYSGRPELYLSELCNKPIDTFFANINGDESIKHAKLGKFKLNTFFEYKPTITGTIRELIISKQSPSCVGYSFKNDKVEPIFGKYSQTYLESFIVNTIQRSALDFVSDMVDSFKDDIDEIVYQKHYVSLPIEMYIQSAQKNDLVNMNCVKFEDQIGIGTINLVEQWEKARKYNNQQTVIKLTDDINKEYVVIEKDNINIMERRKPIRIIYYILFDRPALKKRIRSIFKINK